MTLSRRHFLSTSAAGTAVMGLGLGLPSSFAATPGMSDMPDWHLGYTSAPASGFEPSSMRLVYGKVPAGLEGTLFRNGPAHFLYGQDDYASHWFDGDGMVQRIAIADGKAVHSGRFVETVKHRIEQAEQKFSAPGFGTAGDLSFPVTGPDDVNAANTSVIVIDGELYALWTQRRWKQKAQRPGAVIWRACRFWRTQSGSRTGRCGTLPSMGRWSASTRSLRAAG